MHKDDLAQAVLNSLDAVGDTIVNPRCDECRTPLPTPTPQQIGLPRLCSICTIMVGRKARHQMRDWVSQEQPRGRKVHVVKLPAGMRSK